MSLLDTHIGFVEALRSAGLSVSLAEGLDAIEAMRRIGWGDREVVRTAYAATLVKKQTQRVTFDAIFAGPFGLNAVRLAKQTVSCEAR